MAVELQELDLISIFTTLQPITGMELKGHHLLYQILRFTRTLEAKRRYDVPNALFKRRMIVDDS